MSTKREREEEESEDLCEDCRSVMAQVEHASMRLCDDCLEEYRVHCYECRRTLDCYKDDHYGLEVYCEYCITEIQRNHGDEDEPHVDQ
jgi:predicted RNA-binding Zn-ribbon protein involved in translation (DUF1610 family)